MIDNRVNRKLKYLGVNLSSKVFNLMRFVSSAILFIVLFLSSSYGYFVAPICVIVYYLMVEVIILDLGIKKRNNELEEDALEFMPVFLIALKSNRNVKRALITSSDLVDNGLSSEFKKVLRSVSLGKSLDECLRLLKERISSPIINNIIVSIMEASRLGSDISESINIQLDYVREKKRNLLLKKYKNIPLKLAFFSIIFVFLILIILVIFNLYS